MASLPQSRGKYSFQIPLFFQDLFFLKPNSPEDNLYLFRESSGKLEVGPSCPWEMELAGNLVGTLVGILRRIVKYLQRKNQFTWKQMSKCLASFPVSGTKNAPLLRAAILLTFTWERTPGSLRRSAHSRYSSADWHRVREFILGEPPSDPQIPKEEMSKGEKAKPIKFDMKCRHAPMKTSQSTHSIAPNETGY